MPPSKADQPIADPQRCRHQELINQYQIQKIAANLYQMTANIDRPMANLEIAAKRINQSDQEDCRQNHRNDRRR